MQSLFLCLFHVLAILINCLPINSERELFIDINRDGTLQNNSDVPRCGKGQKLSLKSYFYTTKECRYGGPICSRKENPFSLEAKLLLHTMCSYKEECVNLTFPVKSDLQKYNPKGVLITYECLDQQEKFCDICYQNETMINGTINLIASDYARYFTQCKCQLLSENRGYVSLILKDLRLNTYDTFESRCSDAVLEINQTKIICDENKTDFGCAFNEKLEPLMLNITISFTPKNEDAKFEMVWLVLNVEGSAKMVCAGKQKQSKSASETSSVSAHEVPSNRSAGVNGKKCSAIPGSVYTISIGVTVLVFVMSITISLVYIRKRRKKTNGNMPQKGCSEEELLDDMTYDVCSNSKYSRSASPSCRNDTYDHLPKTQVEMSA